MSKYRNEAAQVFAARKSGLMGKVMALLAFSMVFTALGGTLATVVGTSELLLWFAAICGLICVVLVVACKDRPGPALLALYGATFCTGISVGNAISIHVKGGDASFVFQAAALTAIMTLSLGSYAWTTKRDFSGLGDYLFVGIFGFLAVLVVQSILQAPMPNLILSLVGSALFSLYIIYDVHRARQMEDTLANAIQLTLAIYLDIVNLFLQILASGDD